MTKSSSFLVFLEDIIFFFIPLVDVPILDAGPELLFEEEEEEEEEDEDEFDCFFTMTFCFTPFLVHIILSTLLAASLSSTPYATHHSWAISLIRCNFHLLDMM